MLSIYCGSYTGAAARSKTITHFSRINFEGTECVCRIAEEEGMLGQKRRTHTEVLRAWQTEAGAPAAPSTRFSLRINMAQRDRRTRGCGLSRMEELRVVAGTTRRGVVADRLSPLLLFHNVVDQLDRLARAE